jgi:5-methylcytosine-specific restriction enzyme A
MTKDNFINWLEDTTELANYSIRRYAGAIETLSEELINYGINERNLYNVTDINIIDTILNNSVFQEKNNRGNRMYSAALNHFKSYIEHCKNNT